MGRRIKIYLAEIGTERDYAGLSLQDAVERLLKEGIYVKDSETGENTLYGFYEARYNENKHSLFGRFLRETSYSTRSVLTSSESGVQRVQLGDGEGKILKQNCIALWSDIRLAAFIDLPVGEAENIAEKLAQSLFGYEKGQGYLLCSLSDKSVEFLKEVGSSREEEVELERSLRVRVRSTNTKSIERLMERLQFIDEKGAGDTIERSRDRFTSVSTTIPVDSVESASNHDVIIAGVKQRRTTTEFSLEGSFPSEEETDELDAVETLVDEVRLAIDYFTKHRLLRLDLHQRPQLTHFRFKTLADFDDDLKEYR